MSESVNKMVVVDDLPKSTRGSGAGIEFAQDAGNVLRENPGSWVKLGEFKGPTAQARKQTLLAKGGFHKDEIEIHTRKGTETYTAEDGEQKIMVAVYARYRPTVQQPENPVKRKKTTATD